MPDAPWEAMARRWVTALGVGAVWPKPLRLPLGAGVELALQGGVRLHLRVDQAGLFLNARPAGQLRRPPLRLAIPLETVQMGFREGRLRATTAAPAVLRPLLDHALSHALHQRLGTALPDVIRRGSYHPARDPDLARTLRALAAGLGGVAAGEASAEVDLPQALGDARDLQAFIQLRVDAPWRWPVPDRPGMEVTMDAGTLLALHLHTRGPAHAPRMHEIQLHAQGQEVMVTSTGDSLADALTRVAIRRALIRPGPRVQLDTRMPIPLFEEEARRELEGAVTALVRGLARNLDGVVDGLSVPAFLGMAYADERV